MTTISAIGGLLGLAISIALLAVQTRAVAKQTRISNAIAGMGAIRASTVDLREVFCQRFFKFDPERFPGF